MKQLLDLTKVIRLDPEDPNEEEPDYGEGGTHDGLSKFNNYCLLP